MQEEISKHGRKIYSIAKDKEHSFAAKVKDILIEIFIIVFAVTLSIWLHSWAEHRHEQQEVLEFLRGLKNDLSKDIELLDSNKNVITGIDSNFYFMLSLRNDKTAGTFNDSAIRSHFHLQICITQPNIGRYDGFKSSGKMGTIENDSLKQDILAYYQQTMPNLINAENYVNSLQLKILDLGIAEIGKTSMRDFVTTQKMQVLFKLGIENFESNIKAYNKASKEVKEIIKEIDKEAGE